MPDRPPRILIVDDNRDSSANLSDILADLGFEAVTAENGPAALEKVSECDDDQCFDLCLVDFKMPGMDGAELIELLHKKSPGTRAIMITAFAGDEGIQRAVAAGSQQVLRKPVDVNQLLKIIDEALV